jgi:hypothetical protein
MRTGYSVKLVPGTVKPVYNEQVGAAKSFRYNGIPKETESKNVFAL